MRSEVAVQTLWDAYSFDDLFMADERYDSTTALYRYYCADGKLLYVGISNRPWVRDEEHWNMAPWRLLARYVRLEVFPQRRMAERAEAIAIADERPKFNAKLPPVVRVTPPAWRWYFGENDTIRGEGVVWASVPPTETFWHYPEPTLCDEPIFDHPTPEDAQ